MNLKLYGALALVVALIFSHGWFYRHGQEVKAAEFAAVAEQQHEKENQIIKSTQDQTKQIEVRYVDRIKTVEVQKPDSCLDARIPEPLLTSLRNDTSGR